MQPFYVCCAFTGFPRAACSWVIKNPSCYSVPHPVGIPGLVCLPAPLLLDTEVFPALLIKAVNYHWPGIWLLEALPQMLFLVLVIFNGHIISGSVAVPHVLGHFSLSSCVASPSPVGMDPSLLDPLGNLEQGGKVASSVTRTFVAFLLQLLASDATSLPFPLLPTAQLAWQTN